MQSRTIVIVSVSLFVTILAIGSVALATVLEVQQSATAQESLDSDINAGFTKPETELPIDRSLKPLRDATVQRPSEQIRSDTSVDDMSAGYHDELKSHFQNVWDNFESGSSEVNASMIPHLAEIIAILNQNQTSGFQLELQTQNPELAVQRAQILRDLFERNLIYDDQLVVKGSGGPSSNIRLMPRTD